jgi:hypothetical protein
MTPREFDEVANENLAKILLPFGFENTDTSRCTFYRKSGQDVYHFVMPDIGSRGVWYDVKVFPTSPLIYPLFAIKFPDDLGIPTRDYYLNEWEGVSQTRQQFPCRTREGYLRELERQVVPLLLNKAVPFLDRFVTVEAMLPAIRHPLSRGLALRAVGRQDLALPILRQEFERLSRADLSNKDVATILKYIGEITEIQRD